jgi:hypothetical protein
LSTVKLIFGTTAASEVALLFACSPERDAIIEQKQALSELAQLFQADFGIEINPQGTLTSARHALLRALLLGDLAARYEQAGGELAELATAVLPNAPHHREQVIALCETWRNRLDRREAYSQAAQAIEAEAGLPALPLDAAKLITIETFPTIETRLLTYAEGRLLAGDATAVLSLAQRRKQAFWSTMEPTNQLRWSLLETAANLLLAAARIETELKAVGKAPASLIVAYTNGLPSAEGNPPPWYLLDTFYRRLERQYAAFDLDLGGGHDTLERVIAAARQRYTQTAARCAEAMTTALSAAAFEYEGLVRQSDSFAYYVGPRSRQDKTAYLLVDALRFEMGKELVDGLGEGYQIRLLPVIAQPPTITEVGMAALLPGAEQGMELVQAGAGKVAIKLGNRVLSDRLKRVAQCRSAVSGQLAELRLNALMKLSRKDREALTAADFILITSQEIDRRGEEAEDEEEARRYMDEALDKLRRGIRILGRLGVKHIVVAADHGYLFGDALDSGMKIDPPGGKTIDLHRRVWIGQGGNSSPAFVRMAASQLGLGGNLELAFPRGLGCFKAPGGSTAFFHGGLSLQESIVPLALIEITAMEAPAPVAPTVELTMDKPRITNRLFSIIAAYTGGGLFAAAEKRVQVSVRANRQEIGTAATAAYGFEDSTREITLTLGKPNAITLMLSTELDAAMANIHVIDAVSQVELASLKNVPIQLAV